MKKRFLAFLITIILAAGCLSACQNETQPVSAESKASAASVVAESKASAASVSAVPENEESSIAGESSDEVNSSSAEESSALSSTDTDPASAQDKEAEAEVSEEKLSEQTAQSNSETAQEIEAAQEIEQETEEKEEGSGEVQPDFDSLSAELFLTGGLKPVEDAPEAEELTQDEQNEMERAMRAYTPSSETLLKNKAKTFYYYSKMTKDQKAMYDAMMMVCEDPVNEQNVVKARITTDPGTNAFYNDFYIAYYGMLYDHAELFWLYNGIECDMRISTPTVNTAPAGKYDVYFRLNHPYSNYEKEMKAINKAVKKFLKKIDTSKSKAEIVKQIHNKLVNMAAYNTPVLEDNSEWSYRNFAHTAYGALIADSSGNKNYAVCDGYSQAFVYLLQQCGISAAVIVGIAGSDPYSAGGHAWTVVKLDKEWYEVDSTWNDPGMLESNVEKLKNRDPFTYTYFREAFDNKSYRRKWLYHLYNITTKKMSSYKPDSYYDYSSKDGKYSFCLVGESVHIRASESTYGFEEYAGLMELAPVAKGKKYAVH